MIRDKNPVDSRYEANFLDPNLLSNTLKCGENKVVIIFNKKREVYTIPEVVNEQSSTNKVFGI